MYLLSKKKIKIIPMVALLASGFGSTASFALSTSTAKTAITNGVSVLENLQSISEGGWGDNVTGLSYSVTAASVEALRASNQRTGAYYSGIAWLENHNARNVDLEARKIKALVKHGNNIAPDLTRVQNAKTDSSQTAWGLSSGYYNSPLESALVLQALAAAGSSTGASSAISYLTSAQLSGGWSTAEATTADYWITAEVVLALKNHTGQSGVSSALSQAATFLSGMNTSTVNSITLARVATALYQYQGLSGTVDGQMNALLSKQVSPGNWGSVLATANAVTALSYAVGLNTLVDTPVVTIDQEQLRTAVNEALGHATYGRVTQADVASLTTLDLRSSNVSNLNGLQGASNLTQIKVNSSTSLNAIASLSGVTVIVDSDSDNIADVIDNCDFVSNTNQANMDNDNFGDVCDSDIDGDVMPNSWELTYSFNQYSSGDAVGDADSDQLVNFEEYLNGSNPRLADTDGDLLLDGIEVAHGLDPVDADDAAEDRDNDNLSNADEIAWKTDLDDPDTDSDNMLDGDEVLAGRNPLLNEPVLIVIITSLLL